MTSSGPSYNFAMKSDRDDDNLATPQSVKKKTKEWKTNHLSRGLRKQVKFTSPKKLSGNIFKNWLLSGLSFSCFQWFDTYFVSTQLRKNFKAFITWGKEKKKDFLDFCTFLYVYWLVALS